MRKTGRKRGELVPVARRHGRARTARPEALPARAIGQSRQAPARPRGAMLVLAARQGGSIAVLEPLEVAAQPAVDGTLALLDDPVVATEPEFTPRVAPARRHILIVEDDPHTAGVVHNALELEGDPAWGIEVVGEGLCALESAARTPPDVVLLDVRLPGLDGGEVYRRLRASRACEHTKVLFLSAGTALDLHLRGIDDGVLLRKPFAVPTLLTLVRALLAE